MEQTVRAAVLIGSLVLIGALECENALGAPASARQDRIRIGPGPFEVRARCFFPVEGPRPTSPPFPLDVLEKEAWQELLKGGMPMTGMTSAKETGRPIKLGVCVWKEEDGRYTYTLMLRAQQWYGDSENGSEDVEDVSRWPAAIGRVDAGRLQSTLLQETRRAAKKFMGLVAWDSQRQP